MRTLSSKMWNIESFINFEVCNELKGALSDTLRTESYWISTNQEQN